MQRITNKALTAFLQQVNEIVAENNAKGITFSVAQVRENLNNLKTLIPDGPDLAYVVDKIIKHKTGSVPVRLYCPDPKKPLPVVLHFHGGGHMCGSIELYDAISRKIAQMAHCIVIAVEYRLAPEYPYPEGLNDCRTALMAYPQTLNDVLSTDELIILGDSAGGAICTTLAMESLNNDALKIDKQILIYPSVDYTMSFPSIESNGTGFLLESAKVEWYFNHYFQHQENRRKASAIWNEINQNLPESLVFTAGCDPLRDEGITYANALKNAGVVVNHQHLDGMIHAYMLLESITQQECQHTYQLIAEFINKH